MWDYENENSFSIDRKNPLGKSAAIGSNHFSKLQYRVDATRRAYHRAFKALKELKAESAAAPAPEPTIELVAAPPLNPCPQTASPQIGFVPATPSATPLPIPIRTPEPPPTPALSALRRADC
jgi:hypothetical protein